MKKLSNYFAYAICLIAMSFSTGAFTNAYANNLPGQPVDLTYAAEKALPAVVHIKSSSPLWFSCQDGLPE